MLKNLYFLAVLFLIISCDSSKTSNSQQAETPKDEKAITTYYQNGKIKSYCEVNELRKKHGIAKFYGEDGNLTKSFVYDNDEKITATQHYKNGNPLMEINYKNDQKDGPFRRFYENGQLESEIEYRNDYPGAGLKEYSKTGKLRTKYPSLVVKAIDQLDTNGKYIIEVYFDEQAGRGTYYVGKLTDGKYMNYQLDKLDESKYRGQLVLKPAIGMIIMEKLNFVGEFKTPTGNKYIVEKSFNLAIDNAY
jgi:antitoxin component YwqK of YwqJK toxin-antitoxin module